MVRTLLIAIVTISFPAIAGTYNETETETETETIFRLANTNSVKFAEDRDHLNITIGVNISTPIYTNTYLSFGAAKSESHVKFDSDIDSCDIDSQQLSSGLTFNKKNIPTFSIKYTQSKSQVCYASSIETSYENTTHHLVGFSSNYLYKNDFGLSLNTNFRDDSLSLESGKLNHEEGAGSASFSYFLNSATKISAARGLLNSNDNRSINISHALNTTGATAIISGGVSWFITDNDPAYTIGISYYPNQKVNLIDIFGR